MQSRLCAALTHPPQLVGGWKLVSGEQGDKVLLHQQHPTQPRAGLASQSRTCRHPSIFPYSSALPGCGTSWTLVPGWGSDHKEKPFGRSL